MGRKSKRAKQASEVLKVARTRRGSARIFDGFGKESLWRRMDICATRLRVRKQKNCTEDKCEKTPKAKLHNPRPTAKRLGKQNGVAVSRNPALSSCLDVRRTKAIGAFEHQLSLTGSLTHRAVCSIAHNFKVGSGRTLRRHYNESNNHAETEMMEDRNPRGRPSEVNSKEMQSKFLNFLESRKYHVTVRSVELWLQKERGTTSKASAQKLMQAVGCRRVRANVKPKLQHKHVLRRFIYCYNR